MFMLLESSIFRLSIAASKFASIVGLEAALSGSAPERIR